jgi:hypothetical protein
MIIELRRVPIPEDMDERGCAICSLTFRVKSVVAHALTDSRVDVGNACPSCIEYLGERNPKRFPSIGEYEEALRRYAKPVWPSKEDAVRAQKDDVSYEGGGFSGTQESYCGQLLGRAPDGSSGLLCSAA